MAGSSLHAAQSVTAHDREVLERLCRYGLRAPFSQERLSRRPDGKVVYTLRRPWPHAGGTTHLVLDSLDFLRRLAALVSFPRSHSVRRHGIFANRSRWRRRLAGPIPLAIHGDVAFVAGDGNPSRSQRGAGGVDRRRASSANLPRRVLSVDALACPRCSTRGRTVPMVVLAFLSDPQVVQKILRHLGLPTVAPALAVARAPQPELGFALAAEDARPAGGNDGGDPGPGEHPDDSLVTAAPESPNESEGRTTPRICVFRRSPVVSAIWAGSPDAGGRLRGAFRGLLSHLGPVMIAGVMSAKAGPDHRRKRGGR